MKISLFFPLFFAALPLCAAQNTTAVPISKEPHHQLVLENQYTRV